MPREPPTRNPAPMSTPQGSDATKPMKSMRTRCRTGPENEKARNPPGHSLADSARTDADDRLEGVAEHHLGDPREPGLDTGLAEVRVAEVIAAAQRADVRTVEQV